ncbi:hypothetical protein MyNCGM121_38970 [Achromobacter xylosoxidans]
MATATLLKDGLEGFRGHASLYRCDPPHDGHEFVVASTSSYFGLETYLFPADETGEIKNYLEMPGSMKGTSSHEEVWANAGYEVA